VAREAKIEGGAAEHGQRAVLFRTGRRRQSLGDLLLHHQDQERKGLALFKEGDHQWP
jgi:hypothetical protein